MELDLVDHMQQTPLHISAEQGHLQMVELLLEFGQYVVLMKLSFHGHVPFWKLIWLYMFLDIKINLQDKNGNSPLHLVQMKNSHIQEQVDWILGCILSSKIFVKSDKTYRALF